MGSIVWQVGPPLSFQGKPLSTEDATRWGRIQVIDTSPPPFPHHVREDGALPQYLMELLIGAAQNFEPMNDYVLMTGDNLVIMQFVYLLAPRCLHGIYVLRWDKAIQQYYAVKLFPATVPYNLTRRKDAVLTLNTIPST